MPTTAATRRYPARIVSTHIDPKGYGAGLVIDQPGMADLVWIEPSHRATARNGWEAYRSGYGDLLDLTDGQWENILKAVTGTEEAAAVLIAAGHRATSARYTDSDGRTVREVEGRRCTVHVVQIADARLPFKVYGEGGSQIGEGNGLDTMLDYAVRYATFGANTTDMRGIVTVAHLAPCGEDFDTEQAATDHELTCGECAGATEAHDAHAGHDPQHMDARETCDHGRLLWQSCAPCGVIACPEGPAAPVVTADGTVYADANDVPDAVEDIEDDGPVYVVLNDTDAGGIGYVIRLDSAAEATEWAIRTNPDDGDRPLRFRAEEGTTTRVLSLAEALDTLTTTR